MTSYVCQYCNKCYIRKYNYNNHLITCKLNRISKDCIFNQDDDNIQNCEININDMYKIMVKLHNKYDKLQKDYDELKKYINNTKKKISIIEYLNLNFNNLDYDFYDFVNNIIVTNNELNMIFKNDYVNGIYEIIISYIEDIKLIDKVIPIKSFTQKEGVLYIYNKKLSSWNILCDSNIQQLIKIVNKKLLLLFLDWKIENEKKMSDEQFSNLYVINMKKVVGGNFEKKNIKTMLKNKLFNYFKINLKNIISYEFEL